MEDKLIFYPHNDHRDFSSTSSPLKYKYPDEKAVYQALLKRQQEGVPINLKSLREGPYRDQALYLAIKRLGIVNHIFGKEFVSNLSRSFQECGIPLQVADWIACVLSDYRYKKPILLNWKKLKILSDEQIKKLKIKAFRELNLEDTLNELREYIDILKKAGLSDGEIIKVLGGGLNRRQLKIRVKLQNYFYHYLNKMGIPSEVSHRVTSTVLGFRELENRINNYLKNGLISEEELMFIRAGFLKEDILKKLAQQIRYEMKRLKEAGFTKAQQAILIYFGITLQAFRQLQSDFQANKNEVYCAIQRVNPSLYLRKIKEKEAIQQSRKNILIKEISDALMPVISKEE
jgi:hypothetical protein